MQQLICLQALSLTQGTLVALLPCHGPRRALLKGRPSLTPPWVAWTFCQRTLWPPSQPRGCSRLGLASGLRHWKSPKSMNPVEVALRSREQGTRRRPSSSRSVAPGASLHGVTELPGIHASVLYGPGHTATTLPGDIAVHGGTSTIRMELIMFWRMVFSSYFI